MLLKEFTFVIQTPQGKEYDMIVPAKQQADAERSLRNLFDAIDSRDRIVSLKSQFGAEE